MEEPESQPAEQPLTLAEQAQHVLSPTIAPGKKAVLTARVIAAAADALQLFLFPIMAEGVLSPANDVLDLAVGALLIKLVGFHWVFLPAFFTEIVPGVDTFPTWTASVFYVTGVSPETRAKWNRWAGALAVAFAVMLIAFVGLIGWWLYNYFRY